MIQQVISVTNGVTASRYLTVSTPQLQTACGLLRLPNRIKPPPRPISHIKKNPQSSRPNPISSAPFIPQNLHPESLDRKRHGQPGEADGADLRPQVHLQVAAAAGAQVREGGEGAEAQGEEGHREGQRRRRAHLRRERHPQAHGAHELPPPRLPPRRRRGAPRHPGQDAGHRQVHGQHRQVPRLIPRHGEPPEDVRDHGQLREAVRQHGGAGRVHGGRHGGLHLALHPRDRGQQPHAAGGRRLRPRGLRRPAPGRRARHPCGKGQGEGRRGRPHTPPRRAQSTRLKNSHYFRYDPCSASTLVVKGLAHICSSVNTVTPWRSCL